MRRRKTMTALTALIGLSLGPGWSQPDEPHPGNDEVDGGPGRDDLSGGHGADLLRGGVGHDFIQVEDANGTRAHGGPGRDSLGGFVSTGTGDALLSGGPGNDLLSPAIHGSSDRPDVRGNGGRDTFAPDLVSRELAPRGSRVVVDARAGVVRTRAGRVIDFGSVEVYELSSNTFDTSPLTWRGTGRAEILDMGFHAAAVRAFAGGGADRITGGWRRDLLDGGPGRDVLDGDRGRDRCLNGERTQACEVRR